MRENNKQVFINRVVLILSFAFFGFLPILFPSTGRHVFGQTTANIPSPSPAPSNASSKTESQSEPNDGGEVVQVNTTLVTVPFSATDMRGKSIIDLRQTDFRIYENDEEQEIAYFAEVQKPFTVIIMLDVSGSMWSQLGKIRDAAIAFVEQLRPEDRVSVISFGRGVKVHCEATVDRKKIRKAIKDVDKGGSTRIYDAMDNVARNQLRRIQGRKAIVLFTDGVDATSETATYESTIHDAEELDALVYPIYYDTYNPKGDLSLESNATVAARTQIVKARLPWLLRKLPIPMPSDEELMSRKPSPGTTRPEYDRGAKYLGELAELTGGKVYEAKKDLSQLKTAFANIAEELSRQYSLGYYPKSESAAKGRYRIKVQANRSDVTVRSRSSYIRR